MNSITDLINDKAEEIFPGQASTNATPAPAQDDNIIDLENYDENEIFEEIQGSIMQMRLPLEYKAELILFPV